MNKQPFRWYFDSSLITRRASGCTVLELRCVDHRHSCRAAVARVGNRPRNRSAYSMHQPSARTRGSAAQPPFCKRTLAGQINVKLPLDDPQHDKARESSLEIMLCHSDITEPMFTLFEGDEDKDDDGGLAFMGTTIGHSADPIALIRLPTANYVAMFGTLEADDFIPAPIGDGAFIENKARRFRDVQRGLSNTLVVGERTMAQVPSTWIGVSLAGEDAAARLVGSALEGINHPLADECDYSSRHPGGANFLWGDGHVSFVTEDVDLRLYHEWSRLYEK
jgi:prepilin-type processing-associated H-X9-DG protein